MIVDPSLFRDKFEKLVEKYNHFSIVPHYNPDPDALGSAFAMDYLLKKVFQKDTTIYFSGIIGRAENNEMINQLDIQVINIKNGTELPDSPIIMLDTQPGTGNNPLTSRQKPLMVIDHHPLREKTQTLKYADIRINYGSSSSIVYHYFSDFELKPSVNVATALYYGIQTDIVGEGRTAYKIDFNFMEELSRYISWEKLYTIENPKLPFDYYIHINKGLENGVMYDDFLISSLGEIENTDYIGEIADFLIRFKKAYLVLVMGIHQNTIQVSFRSQGKKVDAGLTLKKIFGNLGTAGGHYSNAGGRIVISDINDIPRISKKIITRALEIIQGKITSGVPFLSLGDYLKY